MECGLFGCRNANRGTSLGPTYSDASNLQGSTNHAVMRDVLNHSFTQIGSSARPTIPSDISTEAQDFLRLTFELDHEARPSAAGLLLHPWIPKKKGGAGKPSTQSTEGIP